MRAVLRRRGAGLSLALLMLLAGLPGGALAHIFLHHAEPRLGAVVAAPPDRIRIWFDGDVEGAFSRITVQDSSGKQVDRGDSLVDPSDPKLLTVGLPHLKAGTFKVLWSAASRDGHRNQGDYQFTVQ